MVSPTKNVRVTNHLCPHYLIGSDEEQRDTVIARRTIVRRGNLDIDAKNR